MNQPKMITQQPVMKTTIPIPENRTTPDKVETSIGTLDFFDGVPVGDTKDTLVDFVQRGRAVEAFINMTPAASMYSLRQGHRDLGLTECNQILIAEQLGDSKPLVLTWNNTSLYTWGFLDLEEGRPDGHRDPARRAGHSRRHVLPLHERHGSRRPRSRQGRQVPGTPARPRRRRAGRVLRGQIADVLRLELHAWVRAGQRPGSRQRQEGGGQHQAEPQGVPAVGEGRSTCDAVHEHVGPGGLQHDHAQ